MITPILYSNRLVMRPFRPEDAATAYQLWFSRPDVAKYMFWKMHSNFQETQEWLLDEISSIDDPDWYRFAVERIDDHQLIGTVLLYYEEELSTWKIAYCFAQIFWNQGFATESLRCVISFAKERLLLERVVARYALENKASGRVLEKLGFCHEKDVKYICNNGRTVFPGALCSLTLR